MQKAERPNPKANYPVVRDQESTILPASFCLHHHVALTAPLVLLYVRALQRRHFSYGFIDLT